MIRVCSGWSPRGRVQYGERFLETFDRNWAPEVELAVWVEEPHLMPRGACRDLWSIPGAREFHEAHRTNPDAQGLVIHDNWKQADRRRGYCFKHDAYKFWKQILIPGATARDMADGDILVWLDGDVITRSRVRADFVPKLLGDADVCYLGRAPKMHSEIGFWAVRLNPLVRGFLALMADWYTSGRVFDLPEWHSAYVWDRARESSGLRERNLCKPGARGHVWPKTALGEVMTHNKGPRKGAIR